jgi:hypothetical protein
MVFAVRMAEGVKGPEDCPCLSGKDAERLQAYMEPFHLDEEASGAM